MSATSEQHTRQKRRSGHSGRIKWQGKEEATRAKEQAWQTKGNSQEVLTRWAQARGSTISGLTRQNYFQASA